MKRQDMLVVAAVAAVTMTFTLVAFGPAGVGAGDDVQTLRAEIRQPTLTSQGCEFALKTDKADYQPGETPTLELTAKNPTDKPVETAVWFNITSSSPRDMLSRMPVMPKPIWIHECKLTLHPGETKTVTVVADIKLPAGQSIAISHERPRPVHHGPHAQRAEPSAQPHTTVAQIPSFPRSAWERTFRTLRVPGVTSSIRSLPATRSVEARVFPRGAWEQVSNSPCRWRLHLSLFTNPEP